MVKFESKEDTLFVYGNVHIPDGIGIENWIKDKEVTVTYDCNDYGDETIVINSEFLLQFKRVHIYGNIYVG